MTRKELLKHALRGQGVVVLRWNVSKVSARRVAAAFASVLLFCAKAVAADLCTTEMSEFRGSIGLEAQEALRDENLLAGPVKLVGPPDGEHILTLRVALQRHAKLHRIVTLSIDAHGGQFVEDLVSRRRASAGLLEESKQVYPTPWGDLVLSHFHPPGREHEGVHSRIAFRGVGYVGLSGECHLAQGRIVPKPHLWQAMQSAPDQAGQGSTFEVFRYDQKTKRVLIVTPQGLWLSDRHFLEARYARP